MNQIEELRTLLYPLGFIASIAFALRFLIQWISSEKSKESTVSTGFWKVSIVGNILMTLHTFIQVQYPLCLIQACNAIISWRNLDLMQKSYKKITYPLLLLLGSIFLVTIGFILQGKIFYGSFIWVRNPVLPWNTHTADSVSVYWHIFGFLGAFLFSSRFWIQWIQAEKNQKSTLGKSFWWISLAGASLAIAYFIRLGDLVNILGYGFGIIPYARNLILINRTEKKRA